jgi:hypothetical protein
VKKKAACSFLFSGELHTAHGESLMQNVTRESANGKASNHINHIDWQRYDAAVIDGLGDDDIIAYYRDRLGVKLGESPALLRKAGDSPISQAGEGVLGGGRGARACARGHGYGWAWACRYGRAWAEAPPGNGGQNARDQPGRGCSDSAVWAAELALRPPFLQLFAGAYASYGEELEKRPRPRLRATNVQTTSVQLTGVQKEKAGAGVQSRRPAPKQV